MLFCMIVPLPTYPSEDEYITTKSKFEIERNKKTPKPNQDGNLKTNMMLRDLAIRSTLHSSRSNENEISYFPNRNIKSSTW